MSDGFAFGLSIEYARRPPASTIRAAIKSLCARFQEWAHSQSVEGEPKLRVVRHGRLAPFQGFRGVESFVFEVVGVENVGVWKRRFSDFLNFVCRNWSVEMLAPALFEPSATVSIGGFNWFTSRSSTIDHKRAKRWVKSALSGMNQGAI